MKHPLRNLVALAIFVGLLVYMMTYTVRFSDTAIITTFGKVGETSEVVEPGLKFKAPAPIQSVTIYDKRAHVLAMQPATHQLADDRQIVISAFLTWRISDPLDFYRSYKAASATDARMQERRAEGDIESRLRSALSEVSKYRLDQIFTSTGESVLPQLEDEIAANIRGGAGEGSLAATGIEVLHVGINRIEFPSNVTTQISARMQETRNKIAESARSLGTDDANAIRSSADAAVEKIMAFARLRAAEIERRGQDEAAPWYTIMGQNEDLAVLLTEIDGLREALASNVKFILDDRSPMVRLFSGEYFARWEGEAAAREPAAPGASAPRRGPEAAE